jgi:hypothetical protein
MRATNIALAIVGLHVLAYAPFYFDGNYPGGGARFFADVLPVEHALAAIAVARLASHRFERGAMAVLALALLGFGVHGAYAHEQLAARDGGRPMFEPDVLARARVGEGLLFVDTDHGFGLAHDPAATTKTGLVVARRRDDDRDWLLFDRLGRPPSWSYRFDRSSEPVVPVVAAWAPTQPIGPYRFEVDAEWPPLAQEGAFALPAFTEGCASQSRALVVTPAVPRGDGTATVSLPVPGPGRWAIGIRVVHGAHLPSLEAPDPATKGTITMEKEAWEWSATGAGCTALPLHTVELAPPAVTLVLGAHGGPIAVDSVTLQQVH